jgi:nicotinate dehydrogenase subunit A
VHLYSHGPKKADAVRGLPGILAPGNAGPVSRQADTAACALCYSRSIQNIVHVREDDTMANLTLTVDGKVRTIEVDDLDMPLLYALRDDLALNNPRFGCGLGQCGACTVMVDGRAVRSCITPVSALAGRAITTLAGIGTPDKPHKVQAAWLAEQVNQCGYCISGWILTAVELLDRNPHPTDAQIKQALDGLICRCGTHGAALRAVKRAAQSV